MRALVGIALAYLCLPAAAAAGGGAPALLAHDPATVPQAFAELVAAQRDGAATARAAALARIARLPRAAVRAHLARIAAGPVQDDELRAGLDVVVHQGEPEDLAGALRLYRAGLEPELESAALAVAVRDAAALGALDALLRDAPTAARLAFVRAVEKLGGVEAARWLARCCERIPDVRREALARLGRLALGLPRPLPDEVTSAVRGVLAGTDAEALRDAIVAAGRMRDSDAIPHLIALLGEPVPGVRADAAWALERTSGLGLGEDAARWNDWFQGESRWWRDESERAFALLQGGERAEKARVLIAIGRRLAWRDKLAIQVAEALEDPDAEVAALAARVAGRLGSSVAVPALQRALERRESRVVRPARQALRAITGKEVPEGEGAAHDGAG